MGNKTIDKPAVGNDGLSLLPNKSHSPVVSFAGCGCSRTANRVVLPPFPLSCLSLSLPLLAASSIGITIASARSLAPIAHRTEENLKQPPRRRIAVLFTDPVIAPLPAPPAPGLLRNHMKSSRSSASFWAPTLTPTSPASLRHIHCTVRGVRLPLHSPTPSRDGLDGRKSKG